MSEPRRRRVLLVGGGGGLLGRAVLEALIPHWTVRSVHRHPVERERTLAVEFVPLDLEGPVEWAPLLESVDGVVNLAWYRWASETRFRSLGDTLVRLTEASQVRDLPIVQVSVPPGPARLEGTLPYFVHKRRLDGAVRARGAPYAILRPTMMFGRNDVLLRVMLQSMHRYPVFPMFADGDYRISPISAQDVAEILVRALENPPNATVDLGGPAAYRYRDVTDRMYALLGRRPRYWRLGPAGAVRLAALLQRLGSTKLYAYEVEWLLSDTLALAPAPGASGPLETVEGYLRAEAERILGRSVPDLGPIRRAPAHP